MALEPYILLHELAHVLSIGIGVVPSWNDAPNPYLSVESYPYFFISWKFSKETNRYVSVFEQSFLRRKDIVYYLGAKLPAAEMVPVYEALEQTNFATLYSATNPHDDFAEAFVSYVHTVLMGKPLEIRISKDGEVIKVYKSCWAEERCVSKKKILERLFDQGVMASSQ